MFFSLDQYNPPSKFVTELPGELLEEIRPRMQVSMPVYRPEPSYMQEEHDTGLSIGQCVQLEDAGSKWLVLAYANLTPA